MKAIEIAVARRADPKLASRFWSKVDRRGPDECWPWLASTSMSGHGQFNVGKRHPVGAHRLSWIIAHDADSRPSYVIHSCDNPPCVNPAHLSLGTHADNLREASERGLFPVVIDDAGVIQLRERVAAGETVAAVARDLGLKYSTAKKMARGRLRPYVGGPLTRAYAEAVS